MSESTKFVLHEVREQQTISIAKTFIITILNARTSILPSNPDESRFNPNRDVKANEGQLITFNFFHLAN
ncbi:unnamed protein product [Ambrosiozyma monospora]|uniref:Unnamed protein product n=2 Tax=Ambrosiozyma monospora TaxID=43982 RepID=A0ACB5U2W7_AMBMO|nr:unnamed protein product [Ambrosiozyma monospora]GMF00533.1 unnamed protein product [Ambrosiozyma monospora]